MPSNFIANGADSYDAVMGRWSRLLASEFLHFAGAPGHGRVLDAGCGTGSLTLELAAIESLDEIEALDFEKTFLAALGTRTSDPRIRVRQGDVCALPYGSGLFDAAYSLLVLHFVTDGHRALREMRRVLRPGGLAAATVWADGGMPSWRLFWDTVRAVEPEAAAKGVATVKRPLTGEGELRAAFESAGFSGIVDTKLTIPVDFVDFDDFWYPMVYGQGNFGNYFDELPQSRRTRLQEAVKAAYFAGFSSGHRSFTNTAWAVRGIA